MKIIILGAGVSGLSAHLHLKKKGIPSSIFEKNSEAGGLCRSFKTKEGFIFDHGPHIFFTKNRHVIKLMYSLLGKDLLRKRSSAGQYSFNTYIDYPYFTNLYGLPNQVIEECISGFEKASNTKDKNPKNYYEWCHSFYGEGFAKNFMIPYANKVWTIDLKEMTFDWVGTRIILPSIEQVKEGAYTRTNKMTNYIKYYRYPREHGASGLPVAMSRDIRDIFYNKEVSEIDPKNKKLTFSDGETQTYDILVSTIPLKEAAEKTKGMPDEIKRYASELEYTSVLCLFLGINRPNISRKQWIYYDDPNIPFNRLSFPSLIGKNLCPEGKSSICAEIPYSRFREINKEKAIEDSILSMIKVGILKDKKEIIHQSALNLRYAYVIYDKNRNKAVSSLLSYFDKNDILCSGRFGTWAYKWTHDAILDGKKTATAIKKRM